MTEHIGPKTIWKSKLALRLVPIFVAIVAVPLAVTIFVVGRVGQEQIVETAHSLERTDQTQVEDAGFRFRRLGEAALQNSSLKIANICLIASKSVADQSERDQAASIATTGHDFALVTQNGFDGAMHQSLLANKQALSGIGNQMGSLFASSAHYTEARVGDHVQTAILQQINSQMSERAGQLAQMCDEYVNTNINYLELTSEMLNVDGSTATSQSAVLDALVRRFPMFTTVTILNHSGRVTNFSSADRVEQPSDLIDQSFAPYFKAAVSDQIFTGVDQYSTEGGAPTLRLAVPIELYRGRVEGVLSACLSLDDLWDTIRNAHFGKSGTAYVSDGHGLPLLQPRHFEGAVLEQSATVATLGWHLIVAEPLSEVMEPIQVFKGDIASNTRDSLHKMHDDILTASASATDKLLHNAIALHTAAATQLQSRAATIVIQLNSKTQQRSLIEQTEMSAAIRKQIAQAQTTNDVNMIAAATEASVALESQIPVLTAEALDVAKQRLGLYAGIIFNVSCVLSCLIGFLLAGALVKPIIRLSIGTQSLARGDLSKRVDERAPAEIGDLAIAFNMMAESLQKSRADLTDAESQLVQSAKLASLGTLSAGVAHELNQPVAIVRGLAQQLKFDESISKDVKNDLEIIEGQTSRMMKIITHLRTFCRTGANRQTAVDINRVVRDCFILIDAQLQSHGVTVSLDLTDAKPVVLGDANELEQVFINLITNARDATESVKDANIRIKSYVIDSKVVLEFKDNGIGIPASVAEHIFDPFFTTKDVGKGTGLGLSISHGIIQKHRGQITAKNDDGAVFTIVIPLADVDDLEHQDNGLAMPKRHAA